MDMDPEPKPFAATQQGRPVYGLPLAERPRRSRLLLVGLPVLAVFTGFAAIVWMAHSGGAGGSPVGEPPLVRAPTAPIKLSPDQAGGSEMADQGEIRELLGDLPFEQQLERLLPPPEEPLPAPEDLMASAEAEDEPGSPSTPEEIDPSSLTAALDPSAADPAGETSELPAQPDTASPAQGVESDENEPAPEDPAPPTAQPSPPRPAATSEASEAAADEETNLDPSAEAALDALIAEVTREPPSEPRPEASEPRAEPATPPADRPRQPQVAAITPDLPQDDGAPAEREPVITTPDQEGSGYRVQLAAVREQADAARAWDLFMLDLGPVLSRYQPYFERADTANGIFYRVQIGPFASSESAETVCNDLKERNASCFVVRR